MLQSSALALLVGVDRARGGEAHRQRRGTVGLVGVEIDVRHVYGPYNN